MLYIFMYVFNKAQKDWIENNMHMDMEMTFARLAGLELLSIGIDIIDNENRTMMCEFVVLNKDDYKVEFADKEY